MSLCMRTYGNMRYMDDGRTVLPPFRVGWRWHEVRIKYCMRWAREDKGISAIERTRNILMDSMRGIEDFLTFTTETEEDFSDGWLPTLDVALRVSPLNQIQFKFWEKPTNSNRTIDRRSSMGENMRQQVLTQEIVRRLGNTCKGLDNELYEEILNDACQKLINSGYEADHVRKIIVAGIKGWGIKVLRCKEEGRRLRRPAKLSEGERNRRKLVGRTTWFKSKKKGSKKDLYGKGGGSNTKPKGARVEGKSSPSPRSVLFVQQTPGGELAIKLRELFQRLEPIVGFYIKVVEKTGRKLTSLFPLTNLWGGASCGREGDCGPCYQGAEIAPDCTQQSVLYENICAKCVPGARDKKQLGSKELQGKGAVLYVGETSRSIQERCKEHWVSYVGGKEDSHMLKHQWLEYQGEPAHFVMRVIGSRSTALSRQISEAVRIRRRGGGGDT